MKRITIEFDGIVALRKFEGALNFLGIPCHPCVDDNTLSLLSEDLERRSDLKLEICSTSASITFKNQK